MKRPSEDYKNLFEVCNNQSEACNRQSEDRIRDMEDYNRETEARIRALFSFRSPILLGGA